jgi:putative sterol carrier protein
VTAASRTAFSFPSTEWVTACGAAIDGSPAYQAAAADWTYGPVALVVRPAPALGLAAPVALWLDLDRGRCRGARLVSAAEAAAASFEITAAYETWKAVLRRELAPVAGIMRGLLVLRGSLGIVVRNIGTAEALVAAATTVPTSFLDDEKTPRRSGG